MNLEEQVKAKLEELRPMLQQDGGDLEFVKMEGKTVTLKLVGHCGRRSSRASSPGSRSWIPN